MAEVHFSGSTQSAADITAALSAAGHRVLAFTPSSAPDATAFWLRAREVCRPSTLEQGSLRDYRALLVGAQHRNCMLHVRQGSWLRVEENGHVAIASQGPVTAVGPDTWSSRLTGQTRDVFTWDGSDAGFVDLIAFFQLNGNLLSRLTPAADPSGVPALQATVTRLDNGQVYRFDLTRDCRFVATPTGTIEALRLPARESLVEGHDHFSDRLFAEGVDLIPKARESAPTDAEPSEQEASEPWFRRWSSRIFRHPKESR